MNFIHIKVTSIFVIIKQFQYLYIIIKRQADFILLDRLSKISRDYKKMQQQQRLRRIQQKIKLKMKSKMSNKLSQREMTLSQKPTQLNDLGFMGLKGKQNIVTNYLQDNQGKNDFINTSFSNKRIKSTMTGDQIEITSNNLLDDRGNTMIFDQSSIKQTPSLEKLQKVKLGHSNPKIKRPSSVINKSTRTTTSRTNPRPQFDHKILQQKIRLSIDKVFLHGIKLEKYCQQHKLALSDVKNNLLNSQINILRLIGHCRKYYSDKAQNQQQQQLKLANGVERQVIDMLKKQRQKQKIISHCQRLTSHISTLIDSRLNLLQKTKIA